MRTVHHPRVEEIDLTDVLHALSDPVRLEIVRLLADLKERPCSAVEASNAADAANGLFGEILEGASA